jgi:uncharacterized protein (TIGR02145 family)
VVYEETHATTTNAQGLVSLNVGGGTSVTGTFSGIQWGSGNKFLQVLMNAGNGNIDLGTQQMMSVPYALFSEKTRFAENGFSHVSSSGDTLFWLNGDYSIISGISAINAPQEFNGNSLLPDIRTCENVDVAVSGCDNQDSILYFDKYYNLVEIGGQCWFSENLATNAFNDGTYLSGWTAGSITTVPALSIANVEGEEYYYNWWAVNDEKNICPVGWHVPSDCEWMYLEKNIGIPKWKLEELDDSHRASTAQCLKLIANSELWVDVNEGLVPNNITGFSSLPMGIFWSSQQNPQSLYHSASWWTSTSEFFGNVGYRYPILRELSIFTLSRSFDDPGNSARSVRCIKD